MTNKNEREKMNPGAVPLPSVGYFEKVSFEQFRKSVQSLDPVWRNAAFGTDEIRAMYDNIKLPERATMGSAGYDFRTPFALTLMNGESAVIPTGIRARIADGWVLLLFPRSSFGFKYRMQLDNSVGIIDSDYYYADNEGNIQIKITCDSKKTNALTMEPGTRFAQGVFMPFGVTTNDTTNSFRSGGMGSTGRE